MLVAVSITKVFKTDAVTMNELKARMEDYEADDPDYIDWYDVEVIKEIWSYTEVEKD